MNIEIRKLRPEDAAEVLEYMKTVGGESDNLTFGSEGLEISVEDEEKFIANMEKHERRALFCAEIDGEISAVMNVECGIRRMAHVANFGISILKKHWGKGVGSMLTEKAIEFAKSVDAEIIKLAVKEDNERGLALYKKYGFQEYGRLKNAIKVNGEDFDEIFMSLNLK